MQTVASGTDDQASGLTVQRVRERNNSAEPATEPTFAKQVEPAWPSSLLGWHAVLLLLLAYTLAYVDRAVLTILVEPIQRDLGINDTGVSLLHGVAFVIFYVTLGLPLGYIADRANRRNLIVASIAFWSVMTASCGLARSFGQLFAARIGVGIGEAGLSPASYSLISDYFPPQSRTIALGIYAIALYLGGGLAIVIGGAVVALIGDNPTIDVPILGTMRSWQVVFLIVGAPGLIMALIALTIREPARRTVSGAGVARPDGFWRQIRAVFAYMKSHRATYLLHICGFSFLGVPFNVALLWARPYFSRNFGVSRSDGAYIVGLTMILCATAGIVCGSLLADALQRSGKTDGTIRVALFAAIAILIPIAAFPFMPTVATASIALGVLLFLGAFPYGAAPAALQLITPNPMRAMVSAIYLFMANVVALSVGPTLTALLTDYVFKDPKAVGYSASLVGAFAALVAAAMFCFLLGSFRRTVKAVGAFATTVASPSLLQGGTAS